MQKIYNKRLYLGNLFDIRDYEVKQAEKDGGCILSCPKGTHTVTYDELQELLFQIQPRFFPTTKRDWENPFTGLHGYQLFQISWKKLIQIKDET